MRHKKGFNHLGRKAAHRRAMLSNMAASLILHKRITTTLQKAKALRSYVEPLITRSKDDTTHSRRVVFSHLQNKDAVNELFREVSVKIADRPGGYTRILKTGLRLGDNAHMCIIELVDYNELLLSAKEESKDSKRTRRGSKKKIEVKDEPKTEVKEEPKAEVKEEPKTEVKEEPKAEEKEEPKAEVKEEPKAEVKEEPKAEVKEEPKTEVKEDDDKKKEGNKPSE